MRKKYFLRPIIEIKANIAKKLAINKTIHSVANYSVKKTQKPKKCLASLRPHKQHRKIQINSWNPLKMNKSTLNRSSIDHTYKKLLVKRIKNYGWTKMSQNSSRALSFLNICPSPIEQASKLKNRGLGISEKVHRIIFFTKNDNISIKLLNIIIIW